MTNILTTNKYTNWAIDIARILTILGILWTVYSLYAVANSILPGWVLVSIPVGIIILTYYVRVICGNNRIIN
jgi:hypothetical protein